MKIVGYVILALALFHLVFAFFTGFVGAYDAVSDWERVMLVIVHPTAAAALVVMLLKPETLDRWLTRNIIGVLLAISVAGDLGAFLEIRQEPVGWEAGLALLFAVVPIIGLAYGITLRVRRGRAAD